MATRVRDTGRASPRPRKQSEPARQPVGRAWKPEPLASIVAAAELLTSELLDGGLTPRKLKTVVQQVGSRVSLPPRAVRPPLHALVARDARFLSLEAGAAVRAQLHGLLLFAPVSYASVWVSQTAEPVCATSTGRAPPIRRVRSAARRAVAGIEPPADRKPLVLRGFPVGVSGALVVEAEVRWVARALEYGRETARVLVPMLDRLEPERQTAAAAGQLLDAADRRVARIGLDLHDGPLQGLAVLGSELSLFDRQLDLLVTDDAARKVAHRRVADLVEMATTVSSELREIAVAGGPSAFSLRESVDRAVRQFESRGGIGVRLVSEGDVERTTTSQRIAVVRVVEEALANVLHHSGAMAVEVVLRHQEGRLSLGITDNGRGFDLARARRQAARDRRLGLAVMGERVRLLGGQFRIDSRPGGPTVISAILPAWDPASRGTADASGAGRTG